MYVPLLPPLLSVQIRQKAGKKASVRWKRKVKNQVNIAPRGISKISFSYELENCNFIPVLGLQLGTNISCNFFGGVLSVSSNDYLCSTHENERKHLAFWVSLKALCRVSEYHRMGYSV